MICNHYDPGSFTEGFKIKTTDVLHILIRRSSGVVSEFIKCMNYIAVHGKISTGTSNMATDSVFIRTCPCSCRHAAPAASSAACLSPIQIMMIYNFIVRVYKIKIDISYPFFIIHLCSWILPTKNILIGATHAGDTGFVITGSVAYSKHGIFVGFVGLGWEVYLVGLTCRQEQKKG